MKISLSQPTDFVWKVSRFYERLERAWKIPFFGSLTIETSLCLTFFLLFMTTLCQVFFVMQLQLRIQTALEQVGNEAAEYCYLSEHLSLWDRESVLLQEIQDHMLTEISEEALCLRLLDLIGEDYLDETVIVDGAKGISFHHSDILKEHHRIQLTVSYEIRLPMAVWGIGPFAVQQQCYRYGWLGDVKPQESKSPDGEVVYVTRTGRVYHMDLSCTYLNPSVRAVSAGNIWELRNTSGGKYYACEVCKPGSKQKTLYITNSGTRYHGDRQCSSIRRDVITIPLAEIGDRRVCSKCGTAKD